MLKAIIKLALNIFTLLIVAYLVPGFRFVDFWAVVVAAVVIGVVNTFIRPILQIIFIPLTIVTHTNPGTYGITITANVVNPEFSDSVKIFANLIESDEDKSEIQSEKQLIFAQDLFNANPGCVELKEYLSQAEEEFKAGRYTKALNLADNAISSCKDLIAFIEEPKPQNVQTYLEKLKLNQTVLILIAESFAFLLTLFIAVKIIRRKK